MIYFLFCTAACNLSCSYCGGSPEDLCMPVKPTYDVKTLASFVGEDSDPIFVFYGGEPLLNIPFIIRVMTEFPHGSFVLQTNATLLHKLDTPWLKKFNAILVSIDGRPETIAAYRGENVYERVMSNLRDIVERGYTGSLVARMACSLQTDIYEDVAWLMRESPIKFDHIYWQLDAEWDCPMDTRWKDFPGWVERDYNPGIDRLIDEWMMEMRGGRVLGMVPFTHVMRSLVLKRRGEYVSEPLRCSAGHRAVSVTTDGRLLACPVASGEEWNNLGSISKDRPCDVFGRVGLIEPCKSCEDRAICGGRCLYANHTKWWGDEGFGIVCDIVRHLIHQLERHVDEVIQLLDDGVVPWDEFVYPAERYSLEIIP